MKILLIQTAFLGDVILTTPLIDALARHGADVDVLVVPAGEQALRGHPAIRQVIVYDKKGKDKGALPFLRLVGSVSRARYDVAVIPHRSLRSAALAFLAGVPSRVGFDRSSGRMLMTEVVRYDPGAHEVDRNLALLAPLTIDRPERTFPTLVPSTKDERDAVVFAAEAGRGGRPWVAVAPGSVWFTKRWPEERFAALLADLDRRGWGAVLVGGAEDVPLCESIRRQAQLPGVPVAAGALSVLGSYALIARASVLLSNDSAPLHMGSAAGTPTVAIFGATTTAFGFGPRGPHDRVAEVAGLSCRPCAVHGGAACPIGTFECMRALDPEYVARLVIEAGTKPR